MTKAEILAEKVVNLRASKEYLQKVLADKLGFSQTQVSRYERGQVKRLNYNFIEALSKELEVPVENLTEEKHVKDSSN